MHTDIVYAIARAGGRPEDPNAAGFPLLYYWLPHLHLAIASWASDWPPTRVYLVSNLASLLAFAGLSLSLSRALDLDRPRSLLALALLLLSTNLAGTVARALAFLGIGTDDVRILGDFRYTPLITKFLTFNPMALAVPLLVAAAWVVAALARNRFTWAPELFGLVLLAIAVLYPPLLPVAGLLFPGLYLFLSRQDYGRWARFRLCGATSVAVAAGAVWLRSIAGNAGSGAVELASMGSVAMHLVQLLVAFGPLLLLAAPRLLALWRAPDAGRNALVLMGLGSAMAYVLVRLPDGIEYKFVFGATVALCPLAVEGWQLWRGRGPTVGAGAWVVPILVAGVLTAAWVLSVGRARPPMGQDIPQVLSFRFQIELAPGNPDREWMMAVRDHTPADAILVEPESVLKSTVFTNRASYLSRAPVGRNVAGFNLSYRRYFEQRGLSRGDLDTRAGLLDELYSSNSPATLQATLRTLSILGRPAVLRLDRRQHSVLARILNEVVGEPIHLDSIHAVWLVARVP